MRLLTVFSLALLFGCFHSFAAQSQNPGSLAGAAPDIGAIVEKIEVNPEAHGLTIEIAVSTAVVPRSNRLTNPDRLVFDLPGCRLQGGSRRIPVHGGPVQELRVSQFTVNPPVTRVVVDATEPLDFTEKAGQNKVGIEIAFPGAEVAPAASRAPATEKREKRGSSSPAEPKSAPAISHPRAYALIEKAQALKVADLQPLEEKAAAGDPEAQTTLALAYHTGVLLNRDEAQALRLLHKAADRGFMAAEETLGIFAKTGVGMKQPAPEEAVAWFKKAARQGSLDAATNIALMYADGRGTAKDPVQALTWFRRAAEGGDPAAQYNLAMMYGRGQGTAKDYKEAMRWLTAAADQNVVPAILDLANLYMHPLDSTPADVERGIQYYEKAADLGSGVAQVILGNSFANGTLVKIDYDQAVKWYRKAAEHGEPEGQFGLAIRYVLGQGVSADLQEARRWFTAAADQGQADAQLDLAVMCEEGKGGPEDRRLASHYYELAADHGVAQAQYRYGLLLAGNKEARDDRIAAYKWLKLAQESIKETAAALDKIRKSMNPQEIAEAEREVDEWRVAHKFP